MVMSRMRTDPAPSRSGGRRTGRQRNAAADSAPNLQNRGVSLRLRSSQQLIFCVLLFSSGAAALVYQVLWIKQLSLVVGIEVYAVTTAVSAFFAGLALGGALFGRLADRNARPLRLYAQMEFGVAVIAVATTIALAHAASPFAIIESKLGVIAWLPLFLFVATPALLMGGTLPVLVRARFQNAEEVACVGGVLYSANTAGAVCVALLTPFFLL